jgi:hypothetical protein
MPPAFSKNKPYIYPSFGSIFDMDEITTLGTFRSLTGKIFTESRSQVRIFILEPAGILDSRELFTF